MAAYSRCERTFSGPLLQWFLGLCWTAETRTVWRGTNCLGYERRVDRSAIILRFLLH